MNTPRIDRRALLASTLSISLAARASAQELRQVTVAVSSTSFAMGAVRIGMEAGLFANHGLRLNIVVMDSGSATMSALLSHSTHLVIAGIGELLAARAHGLDVALVTNNYHKFAGWVVLAKPVADKLTVRPDSPLRDRLKALDGLKIAVPSATSALLAPVRSAASEVGGNARYAYMSQPAAVAALESGSIDGMIAAFPFAGRPVVRGTGVLWIDGVRGDLPASSMPASSSCTLTTREYRDANTDTIQRFQLAMKDVAVFIRDHSPEARTALLKAYSDMERDEVGLAYDKQAQNWTYPFLTEDDMRQELKLLRMSVDLPGLADIDVSKAIFPHP
jgi:ABC-type nitrate/sulfonate/bicarbonate transport system substrate-binding protein